MWGIRGGRVGGGWREDLEGDPCKRAAGRRDWRRDNNPGETDKERLDRIDLGSIAATFPRLSTLQEEDWEEEEEVDEPVRKYYGLLRAEHYQATTYDRVDALVRSQITPVSVVLFRGGPASKSAQIWIKVDSRGEREMEAKDRTLYIGEAGRVKFWRGGLDQGGGRKVLLAQKEQPALDLRPGEEQSGSRPRSWGDPGFSNGCGDGAFLSSPRSSLALKSRPTMSMPGLSDFERKAVVAPTAGKKTSKENEKAEDPSSWGIAQWSKHWGESESLRAAKRRTCKDLFEVFREHFPDSILVPFGSSLTGLALNGADLDVVLLMPPLPNFGTGQGFTWSDRVQVLELCRTLIQEQQSSSKFRIMELVEASVPILRLQWGGGKGGGGCGDGEEVPLVEVDLSVSVGSNRCRDGIRNSWLLLHYTELDESVFVLIVAVKKWADFHQLTGTRHHRLSGYCLALLVIFYLQCRGAVPCLQQSYQSYFGPSCKPLRDFSRTKEEGRYRDKHYGYATTTAEVLKRIEAGSKNRYKGSLFDLFRGFFRFYSTFPFERGVVSVRTGHVLDKHSCSEHSESVEEGDSGGRQWYGKECMVEDPIYRYNVARATSNRDTWCRILGAFRETSRRLEERPGLGQIFY